MDTFEIPVGQSQRLLRVETTAHNRTYKIYAADKAEDWLDEEQARSVDIPADGLLGTITVKGEKEFTFDGSSAFTGQDLQSIAAQIVRHPSFGGQGV